MVDQTDPDNWMGESVSRSIPLFSDLRADPTQANPAGSDYLVLLATCGTGGEAVQSSSLGRRFDKLCSAVPVA